MPEDITAQILAQTAENIQKLYDLSTRIDERVKTIQHQHKGLEEDISDLIKSHGEIMQKVAVLESKDIGMLTQKFAECQNEVKKEINALEKRLIAVESASGQSKDRWNKIFTFILQIVWVLLAAWLLMKLGLQAPAVP